MGLLDRWLGAGDKAQPTHTQLRTGFASTNNSKSLAPTTGPQRREVLAHALRDTLARHGIPPTWVTADMLTAKSRSGEAGIHWRIAIRHWDPRLMLYLVALQNALITRVHAFDPVAEQWLMGISWQVVLDDESACPALPPPHVWANEGRDFQETTVRDDLVEEPSAGVIAGPTNLNAAGGTDRRAELDRLLAQMDSEYHAKAQDAGSRGFEKTQPAGLDQLPPGR